MVAGRELDALVAEKVMGFKREKNGAFEWVGDNSYWLQPPKYSTDISAAWEVVEKIKDSFIKAGHCQFTLEWSGTQWFAGDMRCGHYADTAPMAICEAALKFVDGFI